jgi:DNA-binding GntR family transcriptional regulator
MRLYLSTLHYQEKSQAEHRLLLDACGKGDVKAAQKILRKHMTDAKKNLSRYLSR